MEIVSVTPTHAEPGELVTLGGTSFGPHPGPRLVRLRNQAPTPGCFGSIVDWTDSRVVIQVPHECQPGNYLIAIRRASELIHISESNEMPLVVDEATPAPPAAPGQSSGPGQPRIWSAHPRLVQPGKFVDIYGDLPNPEAATDRIVLSPRGGMSVTTPPQALAPLPHELLRSHVRVRLPASGLAAGEYLLTYVKNAQLKSNPYRIVVRSTEPGSWESNSQDTHGDVVDFRLMEVIKNIGWDIHILGLNLESVKAPHQLLMLTQHDWDQVAEWVTSNFAPLPVGPTIAEWDETRIRIRVEGMAGRFRINVWNSYVVDEASFRKRSNTLWVTLP